jgi:hypothetical protein
MKSTTQKSCHGNKMERSEADESIPKKRRAKLRI